jgi:cardiolipin synthase
MSETDVELYTEGDELYAAMLREIATAHRSVRLESYIFAADEVGSRFIDALIERRKAGVPCILRVDAFGAFGLFDHEQELRLRRAGVRVIRSRRWRWQRFWRLQRRNHRKLLVVDDRVAYLGGFNIHRECSRAAVGDARWRDTQARMEGPVGFDAGVCFDLYARARARPVVRDDAWLLPNRGLRGRWLLYRLLRQRLAGARQRIWLTSPYFVPDYHTQRALVRAARRGVDVRVLLPGKSDVPITQWAARAAYSSLLQCGVRIFEYVPRVLHAKTVLIDDDWGTVGTANVDYRSFFINDELNAIFSEGPVLEELARGFEADLTQSREVKLRPWKRRPWTAWIAETVGWFVRRWL